MNSHAPEDNTPQDDLVARYLEAAGQEGGGPRADQRAAVLAAARAALPPSATADRVVHRPEAANDRRWLIGAVASLAGLGFAGLLMLSHEPPPTAADVSAKSEGTSSRTATTANPEPTMKDPQVALLDPRRAKTEPPAAAGAPVPMPDELSDQIARDAPEARNSPAATERDEAVATLRAPRHTEIRPSHPPGKEAAPTPARRPTPNHDALNTPAVPQSNVRQPATTAEHAATGALSTAPSGPGSATTSKQMQGNTLIQRALQGRIPIDSTDNAGRSALLLAAQKGEADTVRKLLKAGANPRHRDAHGQTAADLARQAGHPDLAQWLDRLRP